jgi:N-carbamoyl-L-amino-acid hydrolase
MSASEDRLREEFEGCFGRLAGIGRDPAGNLWAWWPGPGAGAEGADRGGVVGGSHLDTVRGGGAYDRALGVVGGLLAVGS